MEVISSPNPIDEPNLMYKLQTKLKLFDECAFPNRGYNLVATSSKYGLVFIGLPTSGVGVYYLRDVINPECARPPHAWLPLPEPATHLAVSSDRDSLAVTTSRCLHLYQINALQNANTTPLSILVNDNPHSYVTAVQWNPCLGDTLALAFSDGSLLVGQLKGAEFPFKKIQAKALCLCWSPKGKQLVTGNMDGTLSQLKPDLALVKSVPAPDLCAGGPLEVLAVHWVATYQYTVVYRNAADDSRPYVTIVNTPKAGNAACISFEDVCYSMGTARPWYYYLLSVTQWNLLVAASSNSVEVATLASTDSTNWVQWCQLEEAKPELPLDKKQDSYPVGLAFDTSAVHRLPWGENETLPHMPLLLVLSHTGVLTTFNVVNLRQGVPQLCSPPQPFSIPQHLLIIDSPAEVAPPPYTPAAASAPSETYAPPTAATPPLGTPSASSEQTYAPTPPKSATFSVPSSQPATAYGQFQNGMFGAQSQGKPASDIVPQAQPKPTPAQATHVPPPPNQQPAAEAADSSALSQAELRAAAARAGEEMKAMLVKEVNSFQAELFKFVQKARNVDMKVDMCSVMHLSEKLLQWNSDQIEKDCSLESLNTAIVELKLDIVKTFALLAEARSKPGSEEESRRQVEPLCARTVESVRRRAQQLQTQLEAAGRVLNQQWSEVYARSQRTAKRGDRMVIPALDAIYQPLVRQQEILNRQRALVRSLQGALQDTSLGISKDPLSKLTKNILKMKLEPKEPNSPDGGISAQKLEALRDLLTNHKTTRIKPVNFEVQRHLATMQDTHDRLLHEFRELRLKKEQISQEINSDDNQRVTNGNSVSQNENNEKPKEPVKHILKPAPPSKPAPVPEKHFSVLEKPTQAFEKPTQGFEKSTHGSEKPTQGYEKLAQGVVKPITIQKAKEQPRVAPPVAVIMEGPPASFQPNLLNWAQNLKTEGNGKSVTINVSNIASVARNLNFVDATKPEMKPASAPKTNDQAQTISPDSIILSLLQNKTAQPNKEETTFFGQKICSPGSAPSNSTASPFSAASFKPSFPTGSAATFSGPSFFAGADSKAFTISLANTEPTTTSKPAETLKQAKSDETGEADRDGTKKEPTPPLKPENENTAKEATRLFGSTNEKPSDVEDKMTSLFRGKLPVEPPKPLETKPKLPEENAENIPTTVPVSSTEKPAPFSFMPTTQATVKTTVSAESVFGTPTASNIKAGSIFGGTAVSEGSATAPAAPASMAPTAASIFASPTPASSAPTPLSVFGNASPGTPPAPAAAPPAPSTPTSVFAGANAAAAAAVAAASAVAGDPGSPKLAIPLPPVASPAPVSAGVFASPPVAATTAAPSSVFGTPVPTGSIFGSPAATASPVFGSATPVSVFGSPSQASPASVFGSPGAASVFGSSAGQSPQSVFGGSAAPSSIFGSPATTAASGSMFGASDAAGMFGTVSIGSSAQPSQSSGSVFGSNTSGSVFGGGGGNVFGAKPAFGQASPSSIFGGGGASTFGQKPAGSIFGSGSSGFGSAFGSQTTQSSSMFGGSGGFGSSPSQPSAFGATSPGAQTSMFGSAEPAKPAASLFGSPQQSATAFGGGAVFGNKQVFGQTSGFGSAPGGAFSGFGGSNAGASGFGAPAAFGNKSPGGGFGGGAVFGGSPTFGGGAFGSTSPSKMFGGSSPGFGAPMQQSSTFESLAGQNTPTFGNLAQQSPQPSHQPPSFNTNCRNLKLRYAGDEKAKKIIQKIKHSPRP